MSNSTIYSDSARFYDTILKYKDYRSEALKVSNIVKSLSSSTGRSLLDVACGTGRHIPDLSSYFKVEGLDISKEMLEIAQQRNPNCNFYSGNLVTFNLNKKYDAVTCLFSAIGYVLGLNNLKQAILNISNHLKPGGVYIIEPWLNPVEYATTNLNSQFIEEDSLKLCRMTKTVINDNVYNVLVHFLALEDEGVTHISETHKLQLYSDKEYREALHEAGLTISFDDFGLIGRGLYFGKKLS